MSTNLLVMEISAQQQSWLKTLLQAELNHEDAERREMATALLVQVEAAVEPGPVREKRSPRHSDLLRQKRKNQVPVFKPGEYRLAYYLHQLEVGEKHFVKREDWVSKKTFSERLSRLRKRTEKQFVATRMNDGSGWWVERTL